jgi:hypothetical protein
MAAPIMIIIRIAAPVITNGIDLIRDLFERIPAFVVKTNARKALSGRKNGRKIKINSKIWVLKNLKV